MKPEQVDRLMPPMRCDPDCGECCGPVVASRPEYERLAAYAQEHGIEPRRQGIKCPFLHDGRCAVYPVRPTICRLFGHAPYLVCKRGYNVNVPLTIERRIAANIRDEHRAVGSAFLHAMVYTDEEIKGILEEEVARGE